MIDYDVAVRPRKPSEWLALLEAVRDADPGDESGWLEWKSSVDWTNREQVGSIVARAILGMANREKPSSALEGSGLIVIGLEAGKVHGVGTIDPADLEAKLRPFLGSDGPSFEVHRMKVDGLDVIAIEVPAPGPGSPIYPLRKEIGKYLNGMIFTRGPGRTDVATGDQVMRLMARVRADPVGEIALAVIPALEGTLQRVTISESMIEAYLVWTRENLLAPTRRVGKSVPSILRSPLGPNAMESRTIEEFTREVDEYIGDVRAVIRERLAEFAASMLPPLRLQIDNLSNRHYPGLHMTLFIDGGVIGVDRNDDGDGIEDRLPRPPTAWGSSLMAALSQVRIADSFDPSPPLSRRQISNGDPSVIRLAEHDLRARERHITIEDNLVLLVPAERRTPVIVRWEATAANIDGVVEGSFELAISEDVLDLLLEAVRRDGRLAEEQEEDDSDGDTTDTETVGGDH